MVAGKPHIPNDEPILQEIERRSAESRELMRGVRRAKAAGLEVIHIKARVPA